MRKVLLITLLSEVLLIATSFASTFQFTTANSVLVPNTEAAFGIGDFNGDGNLDAVFVNSNGSVDLYVGNGKGSFSKASSSPVSQLGQAIVVADFNHDGKLDVAVTGANSTDVLLGNGDGTFQAEKIYAVFNRHSILAADFNGDGNPDLLIDGNVLMLGNSDGTFQKATNIGDFDIEFAYQLAVGDFNGDGKMDFAVFDMPSDVATVSVVLGNGDGTFQTPVSTALPGFNQESQGLTIGDFNNDGKLDVAVSGCSDQFCNNPGTVDLLLGNGDGTFQVSTLTARSGSTPQAIIAGDFNRDGNLDLVELNRSADMTVWTGRGNGIFNASQSWSLPPSPGAVAVGDANNDGHPDLLMFTRGNNEIFLTTVLGAPGAKFGAPFESFATEANVLVTGDFNEDGKLDVVAAEGFGDKATFLAGQGDGTLRASASFLVSPSTESAVQLVTADFNNDHHLDLVSVSGTLTPVLGLLPGNGDGTFGAEQKINGGPAPAWVAVGDFNGDGNLDMVVANPGRGTGVLDLLLGNGDGTFRPPSQVNIGASQPLSVAVADLNGDDKLDLLVLNGATPETALVLLGNGDGTFQSPMAPIPINSNAFYQIAIADLNGDGKLDMVVVLENTSDNLEVFLGNGDGTFQPAQIYSVGGGFPGNVTTGAIIADYNGDGALDIAVPIGCCTINGESFEILIGDGHGSFTLAPPILLLPGYVVGGDFNGDGKPDFAFSNTTANMVSIVLNK